MHAEPSRADASVQSLSIGALSRATRIPIETLRTWERRYGAPKPVRKPSGHRLYPATSVEQLRRVGRLLAQGHRPGEILGLSVAELDRLLSLAEPDRAHEPERGAPAEGSIERSIDAMLQAAIALDRQALMRELGRNWVHLAPLRFLQDLAGPLMVAVGRAWQEGRLEIRHEHFASACMADFLREVREPFEHEARGPRVAAAMLPGDFHEVGLLMVSVLLAYRGSRVTYLGTDMPVEQIAAAAGGSVEAVAISISPVIARPRAAKALARLRDLLPYRVSLWVGGAGAPEPPPGVERFANLAALDARITVPV